MSYLLSIFDFTIKWNAVFHIEIEMAYDHYIYGNICAPLSPCHSRAVLRRLHLITDTKQQAIPLADHRVTAAFPNIYRFSNA